MAVHPSRNSSRPTTLAERLSGAGAVLALAGALTLGCGNSTYRPGKDGGDTCSSGSCASASDCPTLSCTCLVPGNYDAGTSETTQTRMVVGSCSDGCCAPCPPTCG